MRKLAWGLDSKRFNTTKNKLQNFLIAFLFFTQLRRNTISNYPFEDKLMYKWLAFTYL